MEQRIPFISPLQPDKKTSDLKTQIQLHAFAVIVMIVIVGCMGFFMYQATQPLQTTKTTSSQATDQAATSDIEANYAPE